MNVTNKLSAESNGLGLHFPTSSKFKLSSKFSKLSSSEIQTIKTLITGYRESAAFLSRSAEELETLINDSYETNEWNLLFSNWIFNFFKLKTLLLLCMLAMLSDFINKKFGVNFTYFLILRILFRSIKLSFNF